MDQERILQTLRRAHYTAATVNDNVSSAIVKQIARVGKPLPEAIAAALLSVGELHAPVTQARVLLFRGTDEQIEIELKSGRRAPGFGNSFFKDGIDPAWRDMDVLIEKEFQDTWKRLWAIAELIRSVKGKMIYPNAAAYTAIVAHHLNMAWGAEPMLVIMGRLPAWTDQFIEARAR